MSDEENTRKWISENIVSGMNTAAALDQLQDRGFACHDITDRVDPGERTAGRIFACVKRFHAKNKPFPSEMVVRITAADKDAAIDGVNLSAHNLSL